MSFTTRVLATLVFALGFSVELSAAQFTLKWTDNSNNETGFTIERAPGLNATAGFVVIANTTSTAAERTGTGERSYVDAGLASETAYTYRVCAFNAGGKSAYSNLASRVTLPTPPTAPAGAALEDEPSYTPPVPVVTLGQGESLLIKSGQ